MSMSRLSDSRLAIWLLVGMAMAPAIVFAILGQFSRMVGDDFDHLRLGLEHGPWQNVLYWRSRWNGAYSDYLIHGLLGRFDVVVPPAFPIIIIAIWILGLAWLLCQIMVFLNVLRYRKTFAVSLAALTVAASVSAFYGPQSFYWYSASARYTFPLALFTVYLALMLKAGQGRRSITWLAVCALGGTFICFISAGFSEMYLVFQLAFLSLLLALLLAFTNRSLRWKVLGLIGCGWLGTMASLAVQWTAPGRAIRAETFAETFARHPELQPTRHLPDLAYIALHETYELVVNQNTITSFLLLFAVGMLVSQGIRRKSLPAVFSGGHTVGSRTLPYVAGLLVQIVFVSVLWSHSSDEAQFFGRFSVAFMPVVMMNIALIAGIPLLIWRFQRLQAFLGKEPKRMRVYILLVMLFALILLAAPQLRDMHRNAQSFLIATALSMLAVAWWEWTSALSVPFEKLCSMLAIASTVATLMIVAALLIVPRWFVGAGGPRLWSPAAYLLVAQGLVWGFTIGQSIGYLGESGRLWKARLQLASAVVIIIAFASIVLGQLRLMPDFVAFAREWDERHTLLLDLKETGQKHIEIPFRAFDLRQFLFHGQIVGEKGDTWPGLLEYYGFDSITLTEDS